MPGPIASICARNAASSLSCSSVNACAAVPIVGTPQRRPASRFEVAPKPAIHAARADETAACSCVRRDPISASGRVPAADTMRAAAVAIALSAFRMLRISVSRITPSANDASTVSTGEEGKYSSPSR